MFLALYLELSVEPARGPFILIIAFIRHDHRKLRSKSGQIRRGWYPEGRVKCMFIVRGEIQQALSIGISHEPLVLRLGIPRIARLIGRLMSQVNTLGRSVVLVKNLRRNCRGRGMGARRHDLRIAKNTCDEQGGEFK